VLSRAVNKKQRGRRLLTALAATGLVAGTLLSAGAVLAVHELEFELEGNTAVDAGPPAYDWESLFGATGNELALPTNFTDSGFDKDFERTGSGAYDHGDDTTYATGSKDTLSISPGWQCNTDNHVNEKIDITNAYAASYLAPATIPNVVDAGDQILYFALERFANDGDANVGFWFLQDEVTCESSGGTTAFTGDHQDGDVLVVSAFTKGGDVSTITAYQWVGDDETGGIDPTPIASGVDCRDDIQTPSNDTTCAAVNQDTIDPPWDNENKRGGANVRIGEFFEGGLNITKAGLGGECFNTFIADTRSSQSLTATLFDFSRGQLGECGVTLTTDESTTNGTIVLGAGSVTDTATVTGTGGGGAPPTPSGTVAFFICLPTELDANGECSTGGTQVGTPAEGETLSGSGSTATATSEAFTPTVVGKHCWRAEYSGDDNYDATNEFDGATECFTVTGTAAFTTAQNWLPNDSATLTGDTNLNGTLTFTLYDNATCSGAVKYTESITVTNAASGTTFSTTNGTVPATTFKVTASGPYSWLVSYNDTTLADPANSCKEDTSLTIDNVTAPAP
jgi:hypothetical protein